MTIIKLSNNEYKIKIHDETIIVKTYSDGYIYYWENFNKNIVTPHVMVDIQDSILSMV